MAIDEFYIDYQKIADAMKFYESRGYQIISVPWLIDPTAGDATCPPAVEKFDTMLEGRKRRLPASGENSYMHMMLNGQLKPGKYVCCTPCYRAEPVVDETRKYWFQKVELIDTLEFDYQRLLADAYDFLSGYLPCKIVDFENDTKDIVSAVGEIELGSYGVREIAPFGKWAYGTGIAEPRTSYVLSKSLTQNRNDPCKI